MFIYVIVNSETLKIYVGQHDLGRRSLSLQQYLQRKFAAARHHEVGGSHLYNAMRKYPRDSWSIHPLISDIPTREDCNYWERVLIKALKAQHPDIGYNLAHGGAGGGHTSSEETRIKLRAAAKARKPRTGWHHTEEEKKLMSLKMTIIMSSPERRQQSSKIHKGKKLTEARKRQISAEHKGKHLTDEHKQQISNANKGKQFTLGHTLTPNHREKIRKAMQGRVFTDEWRAKISAAKMGNTSLQIWREQQAKRTHCPNGHELIQENCISWKWARGSKICMICDRKWRRDRYLKKKESKS
jgi:group I intron endonuclease